MRFPRGRAVVLSALAAACAPSPEPEAEPPPLRYTSFFVTAPSHAAGFETQGAGAVRARAAVARAQDLLGAALVEAGFTTVTSDRAADAVLELTMGGIGGGGEAERLFVAMRDAESGRLVAVFRAHTLVDPREVNELVTPLAEILEEMMRVRAGPPDAAADRP